MSERRPLVLVATTAVALLAGCGSSGHDPQSSFSFPSLPTPSPAIPLGGTQESFATPPKDSTRSARVSVKYNKVNCATTLPGIALSEDYSRCDLVAAWDFKDAEQAVLHLLPGEGNRFLVDDFCSAAASSTLDIKVEKH
jgi:hypothetical protein